MEKDNLNAFDNNDNNEQNEDKILNIPNENNEEDDSLKNVLSSNDDNIIFDNQEFLDEILVKLDEINKEKDSINDNAAPSNINIDKKDYFENQDDSDAVNQNAAIDLEENNNVSKDIDNKGKGFVLDLDESKFEIKDVELKQKKPHKRKKKKLKGVKLTVKIVIILSIVAIAIGLAFTILFSIFEILGDNREDKDYLFEVPKGATIAEVATLLEDEGIIKSEFLFKLYYKVSKLNDEMQFGFHELNGKMPYGDIIVELSNQTTSNETVSITFPEGFTLNKMAKRLEANGVCSAEDFLHAFNQVDYKTDAEIEISDDKMKYFKKEGFAFPDTYTFYKSESAVNVASKIMYNFNNKITPDMYARMNELNMTLEQTIIIASIVQAEAGESDEMKKVASVYLNRLNNKGVFPNLQADPTRGYARELKSIMDIADQEILDAYNTYEGEGLPPGAICNPGMDAINATLYPEETPYYFFCTNLNTREFFYAVTLKEHEQNLWRAGLI